MQLFHASNMVVREPVIVNRFATLDFGTGFYTTTNRAQAADFARKVFLRRGRKGSPVINIYDFDEAAARSSLEFLEFESPDVRWLDFVVHNRRSGRSESCSADIIIGPVANDDVFETVALYEAGVIDAHAAIERFRVKDRFVQVLFCNMGALGYLEFADFDELAV